MPHNFSFFLKNKKKRKKKEKERKRKEKRKEKERKITKRGGLEVVRPPLSRQGRFGHPFLENGVVRQPPKAK
jgi:hypothetical protein